MNLTRRWTRSLRACQLNVRHCERPHLALIIFDFNTSQDGRLLWIGGCLGTYALWSMYFRIYNNESAQALSDLPLLPLAAGIVANAVPVFYFIFTITKPDQVAFVAFCLAFLAPSYVSLHWAFVLLRTRHA